MLITASTFGNLFASTPEFIRPPIDWHAVAPELCLLGVKGRIASFKNLVEDEVRDGNPNAMSSICIEPPRQHSRKPSIVRDNIVTFFGDVPRIELFAREQSPGWSVLGNQSDKYNEQELLAMRKEEAARPKKRLKKK